MIQLEAHALATLFPQLPDAELHLLAADIRQHGQREPILLYEGRILDGRNRFLACRLAGVEPWTMQFDPVKAKLTPEELVISANLRRRHLSGGQMAAIVVELSEQIEREGRSRTTRDALAANLPPISAGRPKTALTMAAEMVGMDERRGRDARAVKAASVEVFTQLRSGVINLHEALEKIRTPAEAEAPALVRHSEVLSTEADEAAPEIPAGDQPEDEPAVTVPSAPIANKPAAPRISRKERVEQAWQDVGRIFRFGQKSLDAFRASQRMNDSEALEFESLESDADKLRVRQAIQNNQSFREAVKPFAGVDPKEPIQKLHTKTVRNDGFFAGQVGEFYHAIVLGDRAALLERLKGLGAD